MKTIHQITAGFRRGDAISEEAWLLRDIFRKNGCMSRLFSDRSSISEDLLNEVADVESAPELVGRNMTMILAPKK